MTRVLIVDDEPSIRQLIGYVLGDEGYHVEQAPDGHAALEMVDHNHPDIIVLDMKMPGMGGFEFTRIYRERHGDRAHILILTAGQEPVQPPAEGNGDSYLSKPFDIDTLVGHIAMVTSGM